MPAMSGLDSFAHRTLAWLRHWWLPPVLVAVVSLGMFIGSPTMAASDAEIHLGTAWFDIHHGLPTGSRVNDGAVVGPCYDEQPERNANCQTPLVAADVRRYTLSIDNYPPPFYWVMGLGELAASGVSGGDTGDGGRLFGLVACLGLLVLAAWRLHRAGERSATWSVYLLAPPMATFLFANANPNGWEVACALFFAATLLWCRAAIVSGARDRRPFVSIGVAGLLLATARPSGAVWVVAIAFVFAVWSGAWHTRTSMVRLAVALLPGVACNLIWNALFRFQVSASKPFASGGAITLLKAMAASIEDVIVKAQGVWGILGWRDTVPSGLVFVALVAVLVYFLPTYAPTRAHRRLLVAILIITFSLSVLIEALGWNSFPAWWQGRYSLPVLAGLAMLLFSDPDHSERPGLFALAGWVSIFNGYLVCCNFWRYDYGISYGVPIQLVHPAYGLVHSAAVYGVVLVLALAAAALFIADRAHREELARTPPATLDGVVLRP
jgi:predicted membrane protein DUF2142